jgi:hypothetical protein
MQIGLRHTEERHMADDKDTISTEIGRESTQKEWRPPALRKLPIAATAGSGKATISGNDGVGGGKGDVSTMMS